MTDRTMTPSKARAKERQAPDPVSYYWREHLRVYHVVLGGSLTVCGLAVEAGSSGGRKRWRLTTFRPKRHRICYNCLYERDTRILFPPRGRSGRT